MTGRDPSRHVRVLALRAS